MFEKIALIAMWIIVPACILFLPRIFTPIYFAFIAVAISDGRPDLAMSALLRYGTILFVLLELSPTAGISFWVRSSILKDKFKKAVIHAIIMAGVVYGAFYGMTQWGFHNKAENWAVGFLFSFVFCPIVGFLIACAATALTAELFMKPDEEEKKRRDEAAAAAAEEAKQKRLAAEAAERERKLAADLEARRVAEQKRIQAERDRINQNKKAVDDFWKLLVKDYGVHPELRSNATAFGSYTYQIPEDSEESVWVRNDERIAAIEKIIQSTGFTVDSLKRSDLTYESAFLEYVFSLASPIVGCTDAYRSVRCGPINGKTLPQQYLQGFMEAIDSAVEKLDGYYKGFIDVYREDYFIMKSGLRGEYAVQEILDMHAGAFLVLHDLRLEFPGKDGKNDSIETDTLVLAPNGIFAVEVKNYGSSGRYKIVVTGDGNWYKEYPPKYDGDTPKREAMTNPFAQNDRHIAFLERFINELLGRGMADWAHVENIICIANDEVTLEADPGAKQTLTRTSNLYNHLTHDRTQRFTIDELNKIKATLEERALQGKKYPVPDHSEQMSWAVDWYQYFAKSVGEVVDAARLCAKDHPEFFDMIK